MSFPIRNYENDVNKFEAFAVAFPNAKPADFKHQQFRHVVGAVVFGDKVNGHSKTVKGTRSGAEIMQFVRTAEATARLLNDANFETFTKQLFKEIDKRLGEVLPAEVDAKAALGAKAKRSEVKAVMDGAKAEMHAEFRMLKARVESPKVEAPVAAAAPAVAAPKARRVVIESNPDIETRPALPYDEPRVLVSDNDSDSDYVPSSSDSESESESESDVDAAPATTATKTTDALRAARRARVAAYLRR